MGKLNIIVILTNPNNTKFKMPNKKKRREKYHPFNFGVEFA
jgi:hypothetical protein